MNKKLKGRASNLGQKLRSPNLKNHPFVVPVATFILLFFFSIVIFIGSGGRTVGAGDARIVNLSVDGIQQTVPTRARTVEQLLERLEIKVLENDIVRPSLDTEIWEDNFRVEVYTARPVTVIDEERKITTVTAEPAPREVAEDAGLKVYPEDKVEKHADVIEPIEALQEGFAAEKVVIDRATPADINLYGEIFTVRTHATTVREALEERNIKTSPDDVIEPSLDSPLTPDTKVVIARVGTEIETEEEEIPAPLEVIEDSTMIAGTETVREEGAPGRKLVTYEIILENGEEVSRKIIQEVVAEKARTRVVVKGTKPNFAGPQQIIERIVHWAGVYGVSADKLVQMARCESTFNPNAINTSYYAGGGHPTGLYQYLPATWQSYSSLAGVPGASIWDYDAQARVTAWAVSDGRGSAWTCY